MPINRAALIACLSLLVACSPRAADSTGDVAADAVTQSPAADTAAAAVTPAADEADAVATLADTPDEEQQARAAAGCSVPDDVAFVQDIRIYCGMPADVQAFIERENSCQHFAGEEPYDDARRRELEAAIARFCDDREKIFADLVARHRDDCAIRQALIGVNLRYDLSPALDLKPCEG
ncbi:hypothetical protein CLM74_10085 [Stenotrophomonas sp. MYb57]|uniref:hypothetical protein n=1 Tax=Stenotrophomonas sp. MYb57 TaxID=1827305 RepID=UPI000CF649F0|nr:hypothetical protein [Stenotrophomonas sp. MYb57]AVJ35272.1 hypothetical protein CLM74_10085 [Stenotrophomonas sp. MYb57]